LFNRGEINAKGVLIEWTPDLIAEYKKCANDPIYFTERYIKIVTEDHGITNFIMRDYQKEMILSFKNNRFNIARMARQAGKTETYRAFILWFVLFHPQKTAVIVANKEKTSREILGKIQIAYRHLPPWIKQGVGPFNKNSMWLENGSRVIAEATSSDAIRGFNISLLVVDEAAHIEHWDEFYASVFSTIVSGTNTKLIMVSTPKGLNHFHKFWVDAENGRNDFKYFYVPWYKVPGRDEEWKRVCLGGMNNDQSKFDQEMLCEFLGSSGSLIGGWKLKELVYQEPIAEHDGLYQFFTPQAGNFYILAADVSHGKGLDYSTFHVIDVTSMPYIQTCVYRNNKVTPTDFAEVINRISKFYNNAEIIIEVNDMGAVVGEMLLWEFDNEHVIHTESNGTQSKKISFGSVKADKGLRITKPSKMLGCSLLKLLVEQNTLIINDERTINELCTFSKKNQGYEAEEGCHDDLVMALVVFSWLTNQTYFTELVNSATLMGIRDRTSQEISDSLVSFGYSDHSGDPLVPDGVKDNQGTITGGYKDSYGEVKFGWDNLDDIRNLLG
jgi:hypothetical protein